MLDNQNCLLLLCLESYPNSNIESDISSRNLNYIYDIEQILHYASKVLLNNHLSSFLLNYFDNIFESKNKEDIC